VNKVFLVKLLSATFYLFCIFIPHSICFVIRTSSCLHHCHVSKSNCHWVCIIKPFIRQTGRKDRREYIYNDRHKIHYATCERRSVHSSGYWSAVL